MATILRVGAYRVVVYSNDHSPAHVHAVGDGHAKFDLGRRPDDVKLVEQKDISKADLRQIAAAIIEHHGACLAAWRRIHGPD